MCCFYWRREGHGSTWQSLFTFNPLTASGHQTQGVPPHPSSHGTDCECYWLAHSTSVWMIPMTEQLEVSPRTAQAFIPFSPTNGSDQVKTSMKFGSQYGCGEQLNCLMFITLFSYFNTAARAKQHKRTSVSTAPYSHLAQKDSRQHMPVSAHVEYIRQIQPFELSSKP